MVTETLDKLANAKASAKASFETIRELVNELRAADNAEDDNRDHMADDILLRIREHPLSVEVRRGWHVLGEEVDPTPAEYRILISTGGPAVQVLGELNEYGEPESAELAGDSLPRGE